MTQFDLTIQRYDNVLLTLPTLKKHQIRKKMEAFFIFLILSREIAGQVWKKNSISGLESLINKRINRPNNIAKVEFLGLKIR